MNDRRYAMNVAVSDMPFWCEPKNTWEKIGSVVPGVEMMFGGPPDDDVSKQIEELEMLISQDVSGLVVFSNDSRAVAPVIDKAVGENIPVITAFADVPSRRLAHVGSDQASLAVQIARRVMTDFTDRIQHQPKALIVIGRETSLDQVERLDGIRKTIDGRMRVLDHVEDKFNPVEAERVIREAFERDGEIKFVFGCNSQSAIGAVEALRNLGYREGDVVITGWDSETRVLQQIKAGSEGRSWIHATAVLYSSYMVQVCFAILEAESFGYLYPDTLNTRELKLPAIPGTIVVPMKPVVTSKNVDEYLGKE